MQEDEWDWDLYRTDVIVEIAKQKSETIDQLFRDDTTLIYSMMELYAIVHPTHALLGLRGDIGALNQIADLMPAAINAELTASINQSWPQSPKMITGIWRCFELHESLLVLLCDTLGRTSEAQDILLSCSQWWNWSDISAVADAAMVGVDEMGVARGQEPSSPAAMFTVSYTVHDMPYYGHILPLLCTVHSRACQ